MQWCIQWCIQREFQSYSVLTHQLVKLLWTCQTYKNKKCVARSNLMKQANHNNSVPWLCQLVQICPDSPVQLEPCILGQEEFPLSKWIWLWILWILWISKASNVSSSFSSLSWGTPALLPFLHGAVGFRWGSRVGFQRGNIKMVIVMSTV